MKMNAIALPLAAASRIIALVVVDDIGVEVVPVWAMVMAIEEITLQEHGDDKPIKILNLIDDAIGACLLCETLRRNNNENNHQGVAIDEEVARETRNRYVL
jgi:hypothetical protein